MVSLKIDDFGTELEVLEFQGYEAISELYEFVLRVSSRTSTLPQYVGRRASLTWRVGNTGGARNGILGRVTVVDARDSEVTYELTVVPALASLDLRSNCRIFQEKGTTDVIEDVLNEHDIDYRMDVMGTYDVVPYLVQYRETDLEFVQRLLEQEGLFYYFEHSRGGHTLVVADDTAAYQPISGRSSSLSYGERLAEREQISDFTLSSVATTERVRLRDFNDESPAANLEVTAKAARTAGSAELYDYPGGYRERNDGFAKARARLDTERVPGLWAAAMSNSPRLGPGRTFRLTGHGYRNANRAYVAVRVEHEAVSEPGSRSIYYRNSFESIPANVPYRLAGRYPSLIVQGPQTATVVGPAGEEIYVDEFGRVKVQFHWDRAGQADENSSAWIRVVQARAGDGWGSLTLPRIGEEVLIEFVDGDPRRPVVVGSLYNGSNVPPYELPDNRTQTGLKTRSTPGGGGFNELRFEDKAGAEEVFLRAEKDLNTEIGNNETRYVENDATLTVKGDLADTVEGDRTLISEGAFSHTIGGDRITTAGGNNSDTVAGSRTLVTQGNYTHQAAARIDLSAGQELKLSVGAASVVLKANGQVFVNGTNIA
jgi:type VI secretion system secreted protein VgrG